MFWLLVCPTHHRVFWVFLLEICDSAQSAKKLDKVSLFLGTHNCLICWYFDALNLLLFYWMVPFLWSFSCFYYWSEIGEHYNTKSGSRSDVRFLKNFFHHNGGYHYIHHKYPAIPWYRLPQAHKALGSENTDISHGFFDTYRQMKTPISKDNE